jgi:hypothetical protein
MSKAPKGSWCEYLDSLSVEELDELCRSICTDCGTDTTPPQGDHEDYMVRAEIWRAAGMPEADGGFYLCIGCLEKCLGRELVAGDFTPHPVNTLRPRQSARLRGRLNRTAA